MTKEQINSTHTSEKLKFTMRDLKIIADYCYKSKTLEMRQKNKKRLCDG